MPNTTILEGQAKKAPGKILKVEEDISETPETVPNPLEELRNQAHAAYSAYLGAQRQVAIAYKQREKEEVKVYKQVEQQAFAAYNEAIQKALRIRTQSEGDAYKAYQEARDKAAKEYDASAAEALRLCQSTIEQQWQTSRALLEQIWEIFQGNGTK